MRRTGTFRTVFQTLELWKSGCAAEFRVEGAVHAWWHRDRYLTGLAWDLIAAGALLRPAGPPRSILMLGLAGGTACRTLRHLLPGCELVAVEIDAEIVDLARKHMELDKSRIEVRLEDAYAWLAENRRRFDVVIDDIYLAGKTDVFRPRAWDKALLSNLCRAIAPGGLLAVNLVTGPGHRTMQSHTRAALRGEFPVLRSLTTPEGLNEVLVAGEAVGTRRMLDAHDAAFGHWRDRDYWSRIAVRKIQQYDHARRA
jgi:predicted O-methyltransferase YrrM